MESSIFTPNVIDKINEFVETELYDDIIEFDISDFSDFEKIIRSANDGQTEFELEIDLDQMEDPDIFERVMCRFFSGYIFGHDYRYMTKITMKLDKESNTLEITAGIVLGSWSGPTSNGDEFVVYDGEVFNFEDYVDGLSEDEDYDEDYDDDDRDNEDIRANAREDFIDADQFDPSDESMTTVISLED